MTALRVLYFIAAVGLVFTRARGLFLWQSEKTSLNDVKTMILLLSVMVMYAIALLEKAVAA